MEYFGLSWSIDPKIVGIKDGMGPCFLDEDFYKRHPWYAKIFLHSNIEFVDWWKPRATMPDHGGPLINIPMEKRAVHTDFIDFGGFQRGFLVNNRLRELLESMQLPRHRYFPVSFIQAEQEVIGYWWLCYDMEDGSVHIDFAKSEFDTEQHFQRFGYRYIIDSYADYMQILRDTGTALMAKKLVFKSNFDTELDIWGAQFLSLEKGYVSDRLLKIFEENKITGYAPMKLRCPLIFESID